MTMVASAYRQAAPPVERETLELEVHVSTAADGILILQKKYGWTLVSVERVPGPPEQPAPWWATREWRGSHVRLVFQR